MRSQRSRRSKLLTALVAACAGLAAAAMPLQAQQAQQPPTVTVWITDAGYQPQDLVIPPNTVVRWTNVGAKVHTATSDVAMFDTGGLAQTSIDGIPSDSATFLFTGPATVLYHSEPDAIYVVNQNVDPNTGVNHPSTDRFWQIYGTIRVVPGAPLPPPTPRPTNPVPASPPAQPTPAPATITITDAGYQPPYLQVAPGTVVTFINRGTQVHTATSDVPAWDTGGLGTGEFTSITFINVGVFPYHSETDKGSGKPLMGNLLVVSSQSPVPTPLPTSTPGRRDPNYSGGAP